MNILSIDLGKYKSLSCMYETININYEFGIVKTFPQDIHDLITDKNPDRVVFEIGTQAGWISLGRGTVISLPRRIIPRQTAKLNSIIAP